MLRITDSTRRRRWHTTFRGRQVRVETASTAVRTTFRAALTTLRMSRGLRNRLATTATMSHVRRQATAVRCRTHQPRRRIRGLAAPMHGRDRATPLRRARHTTCRAQAVRCSNRHAATRRLRRAAIAIQMRGTTATRAPGAITVRTMDAARATAARTMGAATARVRAMDGRIRRARATVVDRAIAHRTTAPRALRTTVRPAWVATALPARRITARRATAVVVDVPPLRRITGVVVVAMVVAVMPAAVGVDPTAVAVVTQHVTNINCNSWTNAARESGVFSISERCRSSLKIP